MKKITYYFALYAFSLQTAAAPFEFTSCQEAFSLINETYHISGLSLVQESHRFSSEFRVNQYFDGYEAFSSVQLLFESEDQRPTHKNILEAGCRDNGSTFSKSVVMNWTGVRIFPDDLYGYNNQLWGKYCFIGESQNGWSSNLEPVAFCIKAKSSSFSSGLELEKFIHSEKLQQWLCQEDRIKKFRTLNKLCIKSDKLFHIYREKL